MAINVLKTAAQKCLPKDIVMKKLDFYKGILNLVWFNFLYYYYDAWIYLNVYHHLYICIYFFQKKNRLSCT